MSWGTPCSPQEANAALYPRDETVRPIWQIITPDLLSLFGQVPDGNKTMHKSRLILLCVIVLVLAGARTAKAQDGVASLEDQIQNKYSEREPDTSATTHQKDKAQPKNNDDGHRKHWWTMPHFRHKKKDENATSQPKAHPKRNSVAANSRPVNKTATQKRTVRSRALKEKSAPKTLAATKTTHRTSGKVKSGSTPSGKAQKTAVASNGHAKNVHQNCSSAVTKKVTCQSVQKHNTKAATRSS